MRTVAWSARASWLTLAAATILLAGCSAGSVGGSVETLAKLDGWRDGPGYEGPFAVLEIAYDDDTAAMLWEDNVGAGQAAHDGLAEVDLSRQVVALYSSGESGSCPEAVHDVDLDDGTVDIMLAVDTGLTMLAAATTTPTASSSRSTGPASPPARSWQAPRGAS